MIFQYTLTQVLNKTKTQTRRVVRPGDVAVYDEAGQIVAVTKNGRTQWEVGRTYAVQPGRTQPQVARIRITAIRTEPVTAISEADAIAEGHTSQGEFLHSWQEIHGAKSLDLHAWALTFELVPGSISADLEP